MSACCPFCASEIEDAVLVCPRCSRDVVVPETLRAEHAELLRKRDRLRAELAEVRAKLAAHRRGRIMGAV